MYLTPIRLQHTIGNLAFIFGGCSSESMSTNVMRVINLQSNELVDMVRTEVPPMYGYSSYLHQTTIIYVPYNDNEEPLRGLWLFDTATREFAFAPCPFSLYFLNIWQTDNMLLMTMDPAYNTADANWFTFDIVAEEWGTAPGPSMPTPYPLMGVNFRRGDHLYVVGGMVGTCQGRGRCNHHCQYQHTSGEAYLYDTKHRFWQEVNLLFVATKQAFSVYCTL
jgi:hypothetical protein